MNPSAETRELFLAYDLLKKVRLHFPEHMKMRGTITERIEAIKQTILPEPWKPMSEHPKGREVLVMMADGTEQLAHWASDMSGSDQPPYEGWFEGVINGQGQVSYYRGIDTPIAWQDKPTEAE